MNDLASYRFLFQLSDRCHYLNHAGVAPTSTRVRQAVQGGLDDQVENGPNVPSWIAREREVRALCARLVGAESDEIAFVRSMRRGRVRVSPHFYNGERELNALCGLLRAP